MSRKGENIYKRKDGRWEGRVLQADGKYRSFYARSYRDVRDKMKHASEKKNLTQKYESNIYMNAADLFENWLTTNLSNGLKPSTQESYYHCIQKYVIPYFRLSKNKYLTKTTVENFVKSVNENICLSESYRKKIISIFKTVLCKISKNIPEYTSVLESITLPSVKNQQEIPVFTMKEQRLIEYAAQRTNDKRIIGVILCFYTGIRIGELCALRWSDLDIDAGTMSVSRTVSRIRDFNSNCKKTQLFVGTPKSRTSIRKIPLPVFLLEILQQYRLEVTQENFYILSNNSEPFDPRKYQRLYKKLLKKSGIKDRKFHAIRHTFATRALELGVDIKTLSEILGHSNVSITLNIYAHSLLEQKKIAIKKFNEMHISQMTFQESAVNSTVIPTQIAL